MTLARTARLRAIQHQFDRRVRDFAAHDFLFREAEARMFERLGLMRVAPQRLADLGCGQGRGLLGLMQRFPRAQWLGVDVSGRTLAAADRALRLSRASWWRNWFGERTAAPAFVQASFEALPFASASLDMLYSNLALHFASDPAATLAEWARVSRDDALLMFSCFGPDTLREVRAAWVQAGADVEGVIFVDMHDLGDMLIEAGYAAPVVDMEMLTLTYRDIDTLMRELRAMTGNPSPNRPRGLTGKDGFARAREALDRMRDDEGLIRVTVELINAHAWRGRPRQHTDIDPQGMRVTHVPLGRLTRKPSPNE